MGELENGRTGWQNVGTGYSGPTDDIATSPESKAHAAAEGLKHRARDQAENAKTQIRSLAETGKDRVAEQLDQVAKALRSTGEGLRNEQQTAPISQVTDRIGDTIEQASRYLREHQAIDLMDEVESAARRQPLLFLGGAFAVGLAIGRFFKSTTSMVESGSYPSGGYGGIDEGGSGYGVGDTGSSGFGGGAGTSGYGTSGYGTSGYGTSGGDGSSGIGSSGYATSAMSALGTRPSDSWQSSDVGSSNVGSTNAGSSDLGPNDLGSSSYGQTIASADIQRGYPMGADVQTGYPEPEQSVIAPRDTTETPTNKRLPGDDDESL